MTKQRNDNAQRHRLSKSEILRGYRAFGRVLSRGRVAQSGNVRCYYDIQREIPPYQCTVGFAVKKPKSSVQRNRVRRLLRESFRQRRHGMEELCEKRHIALRCVFLFDARKIGRNLTFDSVDVSMREILAGMEEKLNVS